MEFLFIKLPDMTGQLPDKLTGHRLQRPTGWAILSSLEKTLQSEGAVAAWMKGCSAADVTWPEPQPNDAQLARIVDNIVSSGGLAGIVATSCRIRMKAYASLTRVEDGAPVTPRSVRRDD